MVEEISVAQRFLQRLHQPVRPAAVGAFVIAVLDQLDGSVGIPLHVVVRTEGRPGAGSSVHLLHAVQGVENPFGARVDADG